MRKKQKAKLFSKNGYTYQQIYLFVFSGKEGVLARDLHLELNTQVVIPFIDCDFGQQA